MKPVTRRCGLARCQLPRQERPCQTTMQPLSAVPRTLLIPLVARALGQRHYPWLACHDTHAAELLYCLDTQTDALLQDAPTVLNVLWRTRQIQSPGGGPSPLARQRGAHRGRIYLGHPGHTRPDQCTPRLASTGLAQRG